MISLAPSFTFTESCITRIHLEICKVYNIYIKERKIERERELAREKERERAREEEKERVREKAREKKREREIKIIRARKRGIDVYKITSLVPAPAYMTSLPITNPSLYDPPPP